MSVHFSWPQKNTLNVGIDLGVDSIKLICLKATKSGHEVMAHALLRRDQLAVMKEFLHHPNLKQAQIRLAIQVPQIKIQQLTVPIVPREELNPVVAWAFKESTNLPIDDYIIRFYQTSVDAQAQKQNISAFAIEKGFFAQWLKFVENSGINSFQMAEPDIHSLTNVVTHNYPLKDGSRCVIIDIGKSQCQLAVVSHNGIEFFRPFSNVRSEQLVSDVSQELGISIEDAELAVSGGYKEIPAPKQAILNDIITSHCEKLCVQAQYAIENYMTQSKDQGLANIFLTGGGARLRGLKEHIQDTLHYPTDLLDPFSKIEMGRFNELAFDNSKTLYAVATGLAL